MAFNLSFSSFMLEAALTLPSFSAKLAIIVDC
jgi:hypothetical protein